MVRFAGRRRRTPPPPVEMATPPPPPNWGRRAAAADRQGLKRRRRPSNGRRTGLLTRQNGLRAINFRASTAGITDVDEAQWRYDNNTTAVEQFIFFIRVNRAIDYLF